MTLLYRRDDIYTRDLAVGILKRGTITGRAEKTN